MGLFNKLFGKQKEDNGATNNQQLQKIAEGHLKDKRKYDERAELFMGRGAANLSVGNYEESLNFFDNAIRIEPNYSAAYNNKGNALQNLGRIDEAMDCYNKAIDIDPNEPLFWYNKACLLDSTERVEEAIESYLQTIKLNPQHIGALNNISICYARMGDYNYAFIYLDNALKINPEDKDATTNMINVLYALEREEEAGVLYEKALSIYPLDEQVISRKAENIFKKDGEANAVAIYDNLFSKNKEVEIIRFKANFLFSRNPEAAIVAYEQYLSHNPQNIDVLGYKSSLQSQLRDYEGELNTLNKILDIEKNNPPALSQKIKALHLLNRNDEALQVNLYLFDLFPEKIDILGNMLVILRLAKPKEEALKLMDDLAKKYPDNRYNIIYRKGLMFMHYQDYNKAIDLFDALNKEHEFAWNYYQIAIINNTIGNTDECFKYLKKTFALDPSLIEDAKNLFSLDNLRDNPKFKELLGEMEIKKEVNEAGIEVVGIHIGSHGNNFAALFGYDILAAEQNKELITIVLAHALSLPEVINYGGVAVKEKSLNPIEGKKFFLNVRAMKFSEGDISFTAFPLLLTDRHVSFETKKIHEWEHYGKVEAEIYGNVRTQYGVGFFATDYAYNKNKYQSNKSIKVKISAFVLSLYQDYPKNLWGSQLVDNFAGYLPNPSMKQNCYYDFVANLIDYKRVKADHDIEGYLLTFPLVQIGVESENFIIEAFINIDNMDFEELKKGMRICGVLWFQGEIA
jgi:tetratricopeptide (TPR) repeat protein